MRLIELSADNPGFKTVRFNPQGISLIVGKQANPEKKEQRKTYNGVGKSLVVELVHFCLGAGPNKALEQKIPNWEFTLEFEIEERIHRVQRNTSQQNEMVWNGKKWSRKNFSLALGRSLFYLDDTISFLTFRGLISRFVRRNKKNYAAFNDYVVKEQPYANLLCNSYLLGLDVERNKKKYELKKELDNTKKLKKNISDDPILKDFAIVHNLDSYSDFLRDS